MFEQKDGLWRKFIGKDGHSASAKRSSLISKTLKTFEQLSEKAPLKARRSHFDQQQIQEGMLEITGEHKALKPVSEKQKSIASALGITSRCLDTHHRTARADHRKGLNRWFGQAESVFDDYIQEQISPTQTPTTAAETADPLPFAADTYADSTYALQSFASHLFASDLPDDITFADLSMPDQLHPLSTISDVPAQPELLVQQEQSQDIAAITMQDLRPDPSIVFEAPSAPLLELIGDIPELENLLARLQSLESSLHGAAQESEQPSLHLVADIKSTAKQSKKLSRKQRAKSKQQSSRQKVLSAV